jgi:hypothetical protein
MSSLKNVNIKHFCTSAELLFTQPLTLVNPESFWESTNPKIQSSTPMLYSSAMGHCQ